MATQQLQQQDKGGEGEFTVPEDKIFRGKAFARGTDDAGLGNLRLNSGGFAAVKGMGWDDNNKGVVLALQHRLHKLDLLKESDVTGVYLDETAKAVATFIHHHRADLPPDRQDPNFVKGKLWEKIVKESDRISAERGADAGSADTTAQPDEQAGGSDKAVLSLIPPVTDNSQGPVAAQPVPPTPESTRSLAESTAAGYEAGKAAMTDAIPQRVDEAAVPAGQRLNPDELISAGVAAEKAAMNGRADERDAAPNVGSPPDRSAGANTAVSSANEPTNARKYSQAELINAGIAGGVAELNRQRAHSGQSPIVSVPQVPLTPSEPTRGAGASTKPPAVPESPPVPEGSKPPTAEPVPLTEVAADLSPKTVPTTTPPPASEKDSTSTTAQPLLQTPESEWTTGEIAGAAVISAVGLAVTYLGGKKVLAFLSEAKVPNLILQGIPDAQVAREVNEAILSAGTAFSRAGVKNGKEAAINMAQKIRDGLAAGKPFEVAFPRGNKGGAVPDSVVQQQKAYLESLAGKLDGDSGGLGTPSVEIGTDAIKITPVASPKASREALATAQPEVLEEIGQGLGLTGQFGAREVYQEIEFRLGNSFRSGTTGQTSFPSEAAGMSPGAAARLADVIEPWAARAASQSQTKATLDRSSMMLTVLGHREMLAETADKIIDAGGKGVVDSGLKEWLKRDMMIAYDEIIARNEPEVILAAMQPSHADSHLNTIKEVLKANPQVPMTAEYRVGATGSTNLVYSRIPQP